MDSRDSDRECKNGEYDSDACGCGDGVERIMPAVEMFDDERTRADK